MRIRIVESKTCDRKTVLCLHRVGRRGRGCGRYGASRHSEPSGLVAHRDGVESAALGEADARRVADRGRHDKEGGVLRSSLACHAEAGLKLPRARIWRAV